MKFFFSVVLCTLVSAGDVEEQFRKHKIVPQIIPAAPKDILEVVYPNDTTVSLGEELTPTVVKDKPKVSWVAIPDGKYTLIMSDPDAASIKGFLHWLVVNITGSDLRSGSVLAEYIGSGPPNGTGLHRYIFTVFKQSGELNFTEPYSPNNSAAGRGGFTEEKFAEKYNLGNPVAGNFYRAQYDDYVPILHSQFIKPTAPTTAIVSVPEYIESSTSSRTLDPMNESSIPIHHDIKAMYISDDMVVHSKVQHEDDATPNPIQNDATDDSDQVASSTIVPAKINPLQDQAAVTTEEALDSTEPIPHDGLIKATFVGNDTIVHYKVDSPEHIASQSQSAADLSGESSDESLLTTESPIPHDHMIIAAFKLNDSVLHTKVLNEEEILHHMTEVYDTTDQPVLHDGVVRAAYVSEDSVIHSISHTEEDLKNIQEEDMEDSKLEASNVEPAKESTKVENIQGPLSEGHNTTGQSATSLGGGKTEYTTSVPESDSESASDQSTEQSITTNKEMLEDVISSTVSSIHHEKSTDDGSNPESVKSIEASPSTVSPNHNEELLESSSTTVASIHEAPTKPDKVLSQSVKISEVDTSTSPTYDIQTTISVSTSEVTKVDLKEDSVSYEGKVLEV